MAIGTNSDWDEPYTDSWRQDEINQSVTNEHEAEIQRLRGILRKVAEPLFDYRTHAEDLGMWLDCGELTEDEYLTIKELIGD